MCYTISFSKQIAVIVVGIFLSHTIAANACHTVKDIVGIRFRLTQCVGQRC